MPFETVGSPLLWMGFIVFVLAMLALDLGVFHRKAHVVALQGGRDLERRLGRLALLFNLGIYCCSAASRRSSSSPAT